MSRTEKIANILVKAHLFDSVDNKYDTTEVSARDKAWCVAGLASGLIFGGIVCAITVRRNSLVSASAWNAAINTATDTGYSRGVQDTMNHIWEMLEDENN